MRNAATSRFPGLALALVAAGCTVWGAPLDATPPLPVLEIEPTATQPPYSIEPLNPLTGRPVADPDLLQIPAQLISISHFPATGRPQAGLSFAPIVYEVPITEGATRFLAIYHGEFPAPEAIVQGDCAVRWGAYPSVGALLGNRVWLDDDGDGRQDVGEKGIGGICVRLLDPESMLLAEITTDTNGYYGFNVEPGSYVLEVDLPRWARPSPANVGDPAQDSDIDPVTHRVALDWQVQDLSQDVGLVPMSPEASTSPAAPSQVGPIRSGRLVFGYIARSYANSCLIFAGASPEVLARLPICHMVFHQIWGGGYMLDISELRSLARENARREGRRFNYSALAFSNDEPSGGSPAQRLDVYHAYQNQSAWIYDALYEGYLRYVDTSEYDQAGLLHPDSDRLTGRQVFVENVIVVFAQHDVLSPTNLDIRLNPGRSGRAVVFRDGQRYDAQWEMPITPSERPRPMEIRGPQGQPFPLKPGHSWILVVTPESHLAETPAGSVQLTFTPPFGAK